MAHANTTVLLARYFANGGKVTKCAPQKPVTFNNPFILTINGKVISTTSKVFTKYGATNGRNWRGAY